MDHGSLSLDFAAASPDGGDDVARAIGDVLTFRPSVRPEDRADALRLRDALARVFAAAVAGKPFPERDVATINSHASDEPPALRLTRDGGAVRVSTEPVRSALAAVARDAIETISRYSGGLRACADASCGRIFLDRSHGKRRRWCSMARCGNRAKVAAFRGRRGPAP